MSAKPNLRTLGADLKATPYRVVREMATGGMGDVYEVEHEELGQRRVMKVLRSHLAADSDAAGRLRAEGRALTRMKSPHLVEVVDFGRTSSGRPFLVTELLEGRTLRAEIEARGVFVAGEAVDVVLQVLTGIETVHAARLVHRDLKPDNIFYCHPVNGPRRTVKILDFGVAKFGAEDREAMGGFAPTADGMLVGSPPFMAPEQILSKKVDNRTDLYAVGLILFRLLVGRSPFRATTPLELLRAQLYEVPAPVSTLTKPPSPAALDPVIARAIAKDPNARFANAAEFANALRAAMRAWVATFGVPDAVPPERPSFAPAPNEPSDTLLEQGPKSRS
ncbi:MAG: serine/threonine-protein kinase [Polyangiaceae bacterium]